MRHGKKFNHLGRTKPHRKAMLSNMACSLIQHKRINTTIAKAKALRTFVEPLITRSKEDSTHSRRMVFKYLNDKEAVAVLFRDVAPKVANRPGGYTRIIRTGFRLGDNAEMCMIELVDYNELLTKETKPSRSRRRKKKKTTVEAQPAAAASESTPDVSEKVAETPKVEDAVKTKAPKVDKKVDEKPVETDVKNEALETNEKKVSTKETKDTPKKEDDADKKA